jgi:hypothetical protein
LAEAEPGRGEAGGRVLVDEESIGDGEAAVGREGLNAGPVEDDARSTEHEQSGAVPVGLDVMTEPSRSFAHSRGIVFFFFFEIDTVSRYRFE